MKPIRQSESSSGSNLSKFTKTSVSPCDRLGKSVMSTYTSLQEILTVSQQPRLPPTPPASPVKSPAQQGCGSCSEIPIKNPLVKQAAMAYLQPTGRPPGTVVEQGLLGKFKEVCCGGQCGCLEWLQGVVSMDFIGTNTDEEDDSNLLMRRRKMGGG